MRIRFASGTYVPWRFRVKRRDLEVHVEGRLGVNSVAVARQAAIEGLALVQTPPIFIAGDLAARRLATVLDEWAPTPATGFFLYYRSRRQMRPALTALVDFLRKERRGASREPRNESTRDRNWEWITCSRAGISLIDMKFILLNVPLKTNADCCIA